MTTPLYQSAIAADRAITGTVRCSNCGTYVRKESIAQLRPRARCKTCDAARTARLNAKPAPASGAPRVATRAPRRRMRA